MFSGLGLYIPVIGSVFSTSFGLYFQFIRTFVLSLAVLASSLVRSVDPVNMKGFSSSKILCSYLLLARSNVFPSFLRWWALFKVVGWGVLCLGVIGDAIFMLVRNFRFEISDSSLLKRCGRRTLVMRRSELFNGASRCLVMASFRRTRGEKRDWFIRIRSPRVSNSNLCFNVILYVRGFCLILRSPAKCLGPLGLSLYNPLFSPSIPIFYLIKDVSRQKKNLMIL